MRLGKANSANFHSAERVLSGCVITVAPARTGPLPPSCRSSRRSVLADRLATVYPQEPHKNRPNPRGSLLMARNERGTTGQKQGRGRAYGLELQGTRRAVGDQSLPWGRRGKGALNALNQAKKKQPQQKHSSKILLQKSTGLARLPLQNKKKWHQRARASISEHPKPPSPPSVPPFDPSRAATRSDASPHCTPRQFGVKRPGKACLAMHGPSGGCLGHFGPSVRRVCAECTPNVGRMYAECTPSVRRV